MRTPASHEPVYRPIVREAFRVAWAEKHYWPVAIFAGILLTGSVYDIIWKSLNALTPQAGVIGTVAVFSSKATTTWATLSGANIVIGGLQVLIMTLFAIVIGFAIMAASVIAQSALVFSIGMKRNGEEHRVRTALNVGARALWPVLALNLITIAIIFACRALVAIAFSFVLAYGSAASFLAYIASFILFTAVAIAAGIIEILALNAMILDGATIAQGIERGLVLLKRHWVVAAETAGLLFLISLGTFILLFAAGMILTFASLLLFLVAIAAKVAAAASLIAIIYFIAVAALILALFGFMVHVHYAAWTFVYRRLGEGGVLPKLHRMVRSWVHSYGVKGA
jgi:hypothetical protein